MASLRFLRPSAATWTAQEIIIVLKIFGGEAVAKTLLTRLDMAIKRLVVSSITLLP